MGCLLEMGQQQCIQHLKNADIIEKQIVNLWVDETHTRDQIKTDINVLNDIMENEYGEK